MNFSTILKPTGAIVTKLRNIKQDADPRIIWFIYNRASEAFGSNKEIVPTLYYQLDIYSKNDITNLSQQVISLLMTAGYFIDYFEEGYEDTTKEFHNILRVNYSD